MTNIRIRTIMVGLVFLGLFFWAANIPVVTDPLRAVVVPGQTVSADDNRPAFKPGEILVAFKDGVNSGMSDLIMTKYAAAQIRTLLLPEIKLWKVAEGTEAAVAAGLRSEPNVRFADLNYRWQAHWTPNDPSYGNQWSHTVINSATAWNRTTGSSNITIAVIDTGVDETHPDLSAKLLAGYDFVDTDSDPHDGNGHGTHVAGIAAASTNNATGIAGLDWQARIMPIRVLDNTSSGWSSDIADGVTWAVANGADIINLSLGGPGSSSAFQTVINNAYNAGVVVVVAMGNTGDAVPQYPAAYNNVIGVGATKSDDTLANYSSYGSHCDISAPGGEMSYYHDTGGMYSTMPTYPCYMTTAYSYYQNYDYLQGTSQAAPMVAGLAGLILSVRPQSTPALVQSIIEGTSTDLGTAGWDQYFGHGRIDADAAVRKAQQQDFLGTWAGVGIYYQNSDTGGWNKLADECQMLTTGDLDGDGIHDLIGVWSNNPGVYAKYSSTGGWAELTGNIPQAITTGDMNGDGWPDLVGTWSGIGTYYRDTAAWSWHRLSQECQMLACGDLDGDGTDELIGVYPSPAGVWTRYTSTGTWVRLSTSIPQVICTGDINGDGRIDLVGSWSGVGVYFRNSVSGAWSKLSQESQMITCGDIDGDGYAELIGVYPSPIGVWGRFTKTGWARLTTDIPEDMDAGMMR